MKNANYFIDYITLDHIWNVYKKLAPGVLRSFPDFIRIMTEGLLTEPVKDRLSEMFPGKKYVSFLSQLRTDPENALDTAISGAAQTVSGNRPSEGIHAQCLVLMVKDEDNQDALLSNCRALMETLENSGHYRWGEEEFTGPAAEFFLDILTKEIAAYFFSEKDYAFLKSGCSSIEEQAEAFRILFVHAFMNFSRNYNNAGSLYKSALTVLPASQMRNSLLELLCNDNYLAAIDYANSLSQQGMKNESCRVYLNAYKNCLDFRDITCWNVLFKVEESLEGGNFLSDKEIRSIFRELDFRLRRAEEDLPEMQAIEGQTESYRKLFVLFGDLAYNEKFSKAFTSMAAMLSKGSVKIKEGYELKVSDLKCFESISEIEEGPEKDHLLEPRELGYCYNLQAVVMGDPFAIKNLMSAKFKRYKNEEDPSSQRRQEVLLDQLCSAVDIMNFPSGLFLAADYRLLKEQRTGASFSREELIKKLTCVLDPDHDSSMTEKAEEYIARLEESGPSKDGQDDIYSKLMKLKRMKDANELTEEEFEYFKNKLIV